MTNTAILFHAGAGLPGDLPVPGSTSLDTIFFDQTPPIDPANIPTAFGTPIVAVNDYAQAFKGTAGGETSADIYAVLSRVSPQDPTTLQTTIGLAVPNPVREQSIILNGYTSVVCTIGTPEINQPVYVRVVTVGLALVGDFEATPDGINNEIVPQYVWALAGRDSNNIAQIRIKS